MPMEDLWTCPHCARQFVNINQSHACGRYSVEDHLAGASPLVATLFDQFVELVDNCGETIIEATKTSIAFKSPGLFAVVHIQKQGIKVGFWLPRRIDHPRFIRIEAISPREYVYDLRVTSLDDLDDQLLNWLCEAYARGM